MFKETEINFYQNEINLEELIEIHKLKTTDEALFVCDLEKVKEKYQTWKKYMPRVKPFYAVKCNNDSAIVKTLADLGTNFDCASKNEIKQILELGVEPERIIFANPVKPVSHIEYAKENNVKTSTVDTECELYKIYENYPESNVVIRYRCDAKGAQSPLGQKFGCDPENDAPGLISLAKSLNLNVIGTSFHVGCCHSDYPVYDRAIAIAKKLFEHGSSLGYKMNLVDIGGGFPGSDDNTIIMISEIVNKSISQHFPDENVNIIAEPGRFFVEAACTLICRIHGKREMRSPDGELLTKMYYINIGVFTSFMDCLVFDDATVTVKHFLDDENEKLPKFKTIIWGPTCDSLDKISGDLQLPDLKCGDFLAFINRGAYTITLSCTFNGFMLPKVLYFEKIKI